MFKKIKNYFTEVNWHTVFPHFSWATLKSSRQKNVTPYSTAAAIVLT